MITLFNNKKEAQDYFQNKICKLISNPGNYGLNIGEKLKYHKIADSKTDREGRTLVTLLECIKDYKNDSKARFMLIGASDLSIEDYETIESITEEIEKYKKELSLIEKEYEKRISSINNKINDSTEKIAFMKKNGLDKLRGTEYRTSKIIDIFMSITDKKEKLVFIDNILNDRDQYE